MQPITASGDAWRVIGGFFRISPKAPQEWDDSVQVAFDPALGGPLRETDDEGRVGAQGTTARLGPGRILGFALIPNENDGDNRDG